MPRTDLESPGRGSDMRISRREHGNDRVDDQASRTATQGPQTARTKEELRRRPAPRRYTISCAPLSIWNDGARDAYNGTAGLISITVSVKQFGENSSPSCLIEEHCLPALWANRST